MSASEGAARLGAARAARLLIRLRLRRLMNILGSLGSKLRSGDKSKGKRAGTKPKRPGVAMAILVAVWMLFAFGSISESTYKALEARAPEALVAGLALVLSLQWVATLFIALGSRELARPEWDMEWLATLPMPLRTLIVVRVAERAVANPFALVVLWPPLTLVAWHHGLQWLSPLAALGVLLPALVVLGAVQTVIDTGLRLVLSPARLRNLQAVLSLLGLLPFYLALSTGGERTLVVDLARALPDWVALLPPGAAVAALAAGGGGAVAPALILVVEAALLTTAAVMWLSYLLRAGFVAGGGRESGRGGSRARPAREAAPPVPRMAAVHGEAAPPSRRSFLTALQRRELRLLSRDRAFLVQTTLLPLLIVGMQFFFNKGLTLATLTTTPAHLCALAFGAAAYSLMFSAFQTLNAEGHALWILYTLPLPLRSLLRQKAILWAAIATAYPVVILSAGFAAGGAPSAESLGLALVVLVGVPVYAVIAISLGVFGSDPLAQEVHRRVRPTYTYLYMMLAGLYVYSLYASGFWQRLTLMILAVLLAVALWQKARDRLPFLLDPAAQPPPRVSLSDGIIAAMIFFVLQGLTVAIGLKAGARVSGQLLLVAFVVAGGATFGLVRYTLWRAKMAGVPSVLGPSLWRAGAWGIAAGVVAASFGLGYIAVISRIAPLREALAESRTQIHMLGGWLAILAVGAAPIFEEWIFRGLVFGGMRRSLGFASAAAASAAVFALMHPPVSAIPVFVLACCTAFAYERTRVLAAPIIAHAVYNAVVLGVQL